MDVLKKRVYAANIKLYKYKLAIHTWGNVSGITKDRKYVIIKPSGVSYEEMKYSDMVVADLDNNVVDSKLKPSSDLPTHTLLYKTSDTIQGIVHTHSPYGVAWAQSGKNIPCLGTTHADNFYGSIPCARELNDQEINNNYEHNTGLVIIEKFKKENLKYTSTPGCLVKNHGPFTWSSKSPEDAVDIALTLEEIAKMAAYTLSINQNTKEISQSLKDCHYNRKHGKNSYYGQEKNADKNSEQKNKD
ncbi:MAG: L-ribulose-5-phosphate 4-epimerase [Mycoplasmataceae bacterium]|nr:L-ribulose-5-phosphate 4-epimerase [Mycoplasmataceae bacterium]